MQKGELPKLEQMKNPKGEINVGKPSKFSQMEKKWWSLVSLVHCVTGGTKWELRELDIEYADDEILELTFSTAWSPPEGVMEELKNRYPDLGFSCFYDEPGMEIAGYY